MKGLLLVLGLVLGAFLAVGVLRVRQHQRPPAPVIIPQPCPPPCPPCPHPAPPRPRP